MFCLGAVHSKNDVLIRCPFCKNREIVQSVKLFIQIVIYKCGKKIIIYKQRELFCPAAGLRSSGRIGQIQIKTVSLRILFLLFAAIIITGSGKG